MVPTGAYHEKRGRGYVLHIIGVTVIGVTATIARKTSFSKKEQNPHERVTKGKWQEAIR